MSLSLHKHLRWKPETSASADPRVCHRQGEGAAACPAFTPGESAPKRNETLAAQTNQDCPRRGECPLQGRRVAVVGGLERMETTYRQVVEKMGGRCLFHCGHLRAGPSALRQVVAKSDLVVCITSVNSHGAMSVVKKECKRCRKPFCPLNGAGAGALENLLREREG